MAKKSNKSTTITVNIASEAIRARKQSVSTMIVIPIEKIQEEVGKVHDVSVGR